MNRLFTLLLIAYSTSLFLVADLPAQEAKEASAKEKAPWFFKIGAEIPMEDLEILNLDGEEGTLEHLRGQITVLTFHSMTCPYMVKGYAGEKKLMAMRKMFEDEVAIVALNSNRTEHVDAKPKGVDKKGNPIPPYSKLRAHIKKSKLTFPVLIDFENVLADRFKATATPHCYVIDQEGILRYAGAIDNDPKGRKKAEDRTDYVLEAVSAIRAGKPVEIASTKAYGCSIKRVPKKVKKQAPELQFREGSCCDRAAKKGDVCGHPCCKKSAKEGEVCTKCN